MKNTIINIAIVLSGVISLNAGLSFANDDTDNIQAIIKHKLETEKIALGVSIAIIENNEIEYLYFGFTDLESTQEVTANTLFEIGSISKTFTSMALASMVKEGKVKLSDPVQKYLPAAVKMPSRNGKEITLLSLANHTSGLARLPSNMPFSDPADPYADYTVEMMYTFLDGYDLPRDIGEQVEYSNLGLGLLGHVLGLIDNKSYEELIHDRVFKPLGMSNSFVDVPSSHLALLSNGHDAGVNKVKHWQLPTLAGAGAIKSNVTDMALYLQANLSASEDFVQLTHEQTTGFDNKGPKVGLAWFVAEHKKGTYLWHNGGTGGFRSFMGFDQANNKGIVILENTANGMDTLGNAYLQGTLAQVKSDIFDIITVDEAKLAQLTGEYELAPDFIMTVTNQEQQLFVQATGQSNLPLRAKSERVFMQTAVGAKITFELDDNGEVIALTLDQGGRQTKALKLEPDRAEAPVNQVTLTQTELENLLGVYELSPDFAIAISTENAQLVIQATNQAKIPFATKSSSEFTNVMIAAKIVFELDAAGKAKSLILFQSGQELKALKQDNP